MTKRLKLILLTFITVFMICGIVYYRGYSESLDLANRKDIINTCLEKLSSFKPDTNASPLCVDIHDHSAAVMGSHGFVKLADNKWIYFAGYSSDFGSWRDLVLAIDQDRNLYACNGHICPTLHLYWPKSHTVSNPLTLSDFLMSRVESHVCYPDSPGTAKWTQVNYLLNGPTSR